MYRITREIPFCYGHRLLNYKGKCANLHGHNGLAVITLESAELDEQGMVVDFTEIRTLVSSWIDQFIDHKLLLHKDDPALAALQKMNEPLFVMEVNPTAENIAKLIFDQAKSKGLPVVEVTLWETTNCFATYREGARANTEAHELTLTAKNS
ncbi:MAG TPA: 6-carboxytetrahydropterin synthase [Candidatus Obscuribacterales bacterium]